MKNILKKASIILLGGILVMNVGCARKGSRTWIENKVSDIERVYPTENLEDLFEKFPNGFIISQTRLFEENGKKYRLYIEVEGEKESKVIKGKVSKTLLKSDPYEKIVEKESEVEYKKGQNLVLAKPELTEEILPRNYFLFQKIQLNKNILGKLQVIDKGYSYETGRYEITYGYKNKEIADYLGVKDENQNIRIGGADGQKNYFHVIEINKDGLTWVIEKKENEHKEQLVGAMRNILKKASIILVGCMLIMNVGCARKGSRAWVENQISDLEKVYPTENAEDLFEEFPNGFKVSQTRIFKENGNNYSIDLEMVGDKNTKKIVGKVSKSRIEKEPRKEIIEKESEVEYKKGANLVLAKSKLTEELLPKNYFLFQKLKLNKDILKKLEVENKVYTPETGGYTILYKIINSEIGSYFNLNNEQVILGISGGYRENDKTYIHTISVEDKTKDITFFEKVVEEKENKEQDTE